MTLTELWTYVRDGGTIFLLGLILYGGWKRWWVFGWYAVEQDKRITKLETALERATRAADRATGVAEQQQRSGGSDA
jgi:hypothetical protein